MPAKEGAAYSAVCPPGFSPEIVRCDHE
ncbi:hypothetical protein DSM3645_09687 [Blastopirellula marina DSM 3645]|uniref:Uncharacterized protein n=1 Tax=Blastopirellula marina DSM 3645 TaxID=314230 RepID=A3ZLM8_9BACT|nr:hypothetical protein DSM3645_09687 [Blastopirellula marina DSM 3645]